MPSDLWSPQALPPGDAGVRWGERPARSQGPMQQAVRDALIAFVAAIYQAEATKATPRTAAISNAVVGLCEPHNTPCGEKLW